MKIIKRLATVIIFTVLFAVAGCLVLGYGARLFTHPSDENDFTSLIFAFIGLLIGAPVGFSYGIRRGSQDFHLVRPNKNK